MRYTETVIKYRWVVIFLCLVAVVASGYGMTRLGFENDGMYMENKEQAKQRRSCGQTTASKPDFQTRTLTKMR